MSLIWFEGGDGTGKGTQLEMVKARLEQGGTSCTPIESLVVTL